jgi:hypothetical protein
MDQVKVWRGRHGDPVPLFGPLPGVRADDVLAYEFELSSQFTPWPGRTLLERVFVLLDLGVSMSCPPWRCTATASREASGPGTWYVDLVHVTARPGSFVIRDLYIDVMVPTDGRHQRLLDLDEFADAMEAGQLETGIAIDGLRRWQRFLDRHLHAARDPAPGWTDFPPRRLRELAALATPLGPVVTVPE